MLWPLWTYAYLLTLTIIILEYILTEHILTKKLIKAIARLNLETYKEIYNLYWIYIEYQVIHRVSRSVGNMPMILLQSKKLFKLNIILKFVDSLLYVLE
jgi:hypothetical protein